MRLTTYFVSTPHESNRIIDKNINVLAVVDLSNFRFATDRQRSTVKLYHRSQLLQLVHSPIVSDNHCKTYWFVSFYRVRFTSKWIKIYSEVSYYDSSSNSNGKKESGVNLFLNRCGLAFFFCYRRAIFLKHKPNFFFFLSNVHRRHFLFIKNKNKTNLVGNFKSTRPVLVRVIERVESWKHF